MQVITRWFTFVLGLVASGSAFGAGMSVAFAPTNAPNLIGLGVGLIPDYFGSGDYTWGVAPVARYQFKGTERYALLLANEGQLNLIDDDSWRAGPVLNYNFGRSDVDDAVVSRMRDLDGYLEYGAFVSYTSTDQRNPRNRWGVGLTGLANSKDGNKGYRVRLSAQVFHQVSPAVDLTFGAGLWYGDKDWNNYHFGVNATNIGTSGLPFYTAGSGVNQYYVNAGPVVYLNKNWALGAGVRYAMIPGDAGDSPLVDGPGGRGAKGQWVAGVGVTYITW